MSSQPERQVPYQVKIITKKNVKKVNINIRQIHISDYYPDNKLQRHKKRQKAFNDIKIESNLDTFEIFQKHIARTCEERKKQNNGSKGLCQRRT